MDYISKIAIYIFAIGLIACGGAEKETSSTSSESTPAKVEKPVSDKGIGETQQVTLNTPLNDVMVVEGKAIYEMKCSACHRLTAKRIVGPGFTGVTERRKPEWIMNMITNVEVMLDEDPEAQKLLEECLTRMPNQNLTVAEARSVLEFLYKNDQGI